MSATMAEVQMVLDGCRLEVRINDGGRGSWEIGRYIDQRSEKCDAAARHGRGIRDQASRKRAIGNAENTV